MNEMEEFIALIRHQTVDATARIEEKLTAKITNSASKQDTRLHLDDLARAVADTNAGTDKHLLVELQICSNQPAFTSPVSIRATSPWCC